MSSPVLIEYFRRDDDDGHWIDVKVNRLPYDSVGPFDTQAERDRAFDDLIDMSRQCGARDLPPMQ